MTGLIASLFLRWPLLARIPWKLIGALLVCVLLFGAGWKVRGWKEANATLRAVEQARKVEREAFAERDERFKALARADALLLAGYAAERDQLQANLAKLQAAAVSLPLTRTITKVIHEDCSCPDTRLGSAMRVCFNAATSGDAIAIAACEAERVPSGVPDQ